MSWPRRLSILYALLLAASYVTWALHDDARLLPPGVTTLDVAAVPASAGAPAVKLAHRDSGPRDAPVMVLLHGSPGRLRDFDAVTKLLVPDLRVIAVDLPGFGDSSHDVPDVSSRAHAAYVAELLDALHVRSVHLLGHSMGGAVALEFAHAHPDRVRSVTLLAAIGVQELEMFGRYDLNHLVHVAQLALIEGARWLTPHFGAADRFPLNVPYARNFAETDQRPLRGILRELEMPVRIVHGRSDFLVPVEVALEHHRIVPQSELELLDSSHFLPWTDTREVARGTLDFVRRVEDGRGVRRADADPARVTEAAAPWDPRTAPRFAGPTLLVMMLLLFVATFVSEDLTCIATGFVVAQGRLSLTAGILACFFGLVVGDLLLYLAGRAFGAPALRRRPLKWMVSRDAVERASVWFEKRGLRVVILARVVPGMRLPTYVAAGVLRVNVWMCIFHFAVAAAIWTPALVGGASLLGNALGASTDLMERSTGLAFLVVAFAFVVTERVVLRLFTRRSRKLLSGSWRKWAHFEFWPWWLVYMPVFVYIAWLALRHRSLRVVTACNPAIPAGGIVGESKSHILDGLRGVPDALARHTVLAVTDDAATRLERLDRFLAGNALDYPVVLKPDVGERGTGVTVVRDRARAAHDLERAEGDVIAQEFVPGPEYGVLWERRPGEPGGRITSITAKRPPVVVGDGRSRLADLIVSDRRAACMGAKYLMLNEERLHDVPAAGEEVPIAHLGNHCLGSLFLDGNDLLTSELTAAFDRLGCAHPGFFLGRFDVRAASEEAFGRGEFKVIELNGLTSEPGHIYDPVRGTVRGAYRALFAHWRAAFEIGAANVARGVPVATWESLSCPRRARKGIGGRV